MPSKMNDSTVVMTFTTNIKQ